MLALVNYYPSFYTIILAGVLLGANLISYLRIAPRTKKPMSIVLGTEGIVLSIQGPLYKEQVKASYHHHWDFGVGQLWVVTAAQKKHFLYFPRCLYSQLMYSKITLHWQYILSLAQKSSPTP